MKNLIIAFLLLISSASLAQKFENIKVNVGKEEIVVDKVTIKKNTKIDEVIKVFGKAERVVQKAGQDRIFIYDSKGIAFNVKAGGSRMIESITITYTYDDDKNVASGKYAGKVIIDQLGVTENTTTAEINEKTALELQCMGTMCVTDPKGKGVLMLLGLTESNKILQMAFGFKP